MKIKDIRASLHGFSITIPLLEGRVEGYGREEQKHFVFCEVETDEGHVGYGLTGHFLAKSVITALNDSEIYKFLEKPVPLPTLRQVVRSAFDLFERHDPDSEPDDAPNNVLVG